MGICQTGVVDGVLPREEGGEIGIFDLWLDGRGTCACLVAEGGEGGGAEGGVGFRFRFGEGFGETLVLLVEPCRFPFLYNRFGGAGAGMLFMRGAGSECMEEDGTRKPEPDHATGKEGGAKHSRAPGGAELSGGGVSGRGMR